MWLEVVSVSNAVMWKLPAIPSHCVATGSRNPSYSEFRNALVSEFFL